MFEGGFCTPLPRDRSSVVADLTDREPNGSQLALLATGRAFLVRKSGRRLLIPAAAGGAVGSGAVYAKNLPKPGTYVLDPVRFAVETTRNRKWYPAKAWPGFGEKVSFPIDKTGVVSRLFVTYEGLMTGDGAVAPTVEGAFPWNLAKRFQVTANGLSNLVYAQGIDMRILERIRRGFFFDRESIFTLPAAATATPIRLAWEIPLAFDESLVGAVYAQTEDTDMELEIQAPAASELFTAHAPVMTGSFKVGVEFFSLPLDDSKEGRKVIIPDIRQLHGVIGKDDAITGTGEHTVNLMRTGGILVRAFQRFDNAYPDAGNLDPGTLINSHKFRYGSNVIPTDEPGRAIRKENERLYGDKMLPAADVDASITAGVNVLVDDFVAANSVRDVVHLLGTTQPQLLNEIDGTALIIAGAKVHTVQEHMVAG
jgi:hypothetical protein